MSAMVRKCTGIPRAFAVCLLLAAAGVGAQEPATPDCESIEAGVDYAAIVEVDGEIEKPLKNPIETLQQLLKANGFLTDQVDNANGPQTRNALTRLCEFLRLVENRAQAAATGDSDGEPSSASAEAVTEEAAATAEAEAKAALEAAQQLTAEAEQAAAEAAAAGTEESRQAADAKRAAATSANEEAEAKSRAATALRAEVDAVAPPTPAEFANWLYQGLKAVSNGTGPDGNKLGNLVDLDGGGCGCWRGFPAKIYGFYPYWLADGGRQQVDFSLLEGIGFLGLRLDQDGAISNPSLWVGDKEALDPVEAASRAATTRFIRAAVRHKVRVDVTYHMANWMDWEVAGEAMRRAVTGIRDSAMQKFSHRGEADNLLETFLRWLRRNLPLIDDDSTVYADGVNLYFDSYTSGADADKLIWIVRQLREELRAERADFRLNVILGLNWSGIRETVKVDSDGVVANIGDDLFAVLQQLLTEKLPLEPDATDDAGEQIDTVTGLFVFLPQNTADDKRITSRSKKLLRRVIEDAFDGNGAGRRAVLRKTLPIITTLPSVVTYDPEYFHEGGQFTEDLIYLENNFAGAGLWPLPFTPLPDEPPAEAPEEAASPVEASGPAGPGETEVGQIEEQLLAQFAPVAAAGPLRGWVEGEVEELCAFACPNRWLFRLAFDFLAGILAIYGLLAVGNCRLREFYQKRFFYFYAYGFVTAMVFAVSLVCDPFLKGEASLVMAAILLALVAFIVLRQVRRALRPRMP